MILLIFLFDLLLSAYAAKVPAKGEAPIRKSPIPVCLPSSKEVVIAEPIVDPTVPPIVDNKFPPSSYYLFLF